MLENDYCPYCKAELEPEDVVEVCDITGNKQVECPNCGKHIRASFEPRLCMSLTSEEYYLRQLEREKESYKKRLKSEDDQEGKDFYEMMIKEVDEKIAEAKANIEENKNQE
ncbi:hypothetical protein [Anaerococcus tetradius]|uniref:Uncharacterized protein n=1 Tax=Anaerococcus tetradius ATCC 35098 TaxID=525255 RepID=C2CFZ9_9FIRM|nr:hypothetical protein [Anaerococcus tetradius]EEI83527.1 hypothetical protein HMPREF0077_0409 [Anaerococcus tetradius ATCC 35098]